MPYRHQGRTKIGVDCIGLVIVVAKALELTNYDTLNYSRIPDGATMERQIREHMRPINLSERRPGDVLHIGFYRHAQHVAIVSYNDYIIHAYERSGKVVEHRLDSVWRSRIRGTYRFYGIEE